MKRSIQFYVLGAGLIFMICICSLMLGMAQKQGRMLETQLHDHASALFDLIVMTRRWNSQYSGVYVKKTPGVESNPYLVNPDIADTAGVIYTRKNPALMTREISEIAKAEKSLIFHITSLKLRNKENAPDEWERAALEDFERGLEKKTGSMEIDGSKYYRFMKPLYVEESCLVCHADQGYKVGEVRGGISINVPYTETLNAIRKNSVMMISLLVALLCIFALTLYLFVWKVMYRLEDQREQLEHLNKTKNKFLGMCAHDMRNPLTSIMGFCELIMSGETGDLNDDMKKFLEIIYTSSLKMLDMINNLLDITVIESGRLELHLHRGSIKALLEEQVEISRFLAERKSISIKSKLDNTSEINFDKYRISQVLDNIIGNAIKYSPQGSIIYVTLQENNGFIRIAVRDEGPGIPKEDQEKMFQEYRRLKAQATGGEKSAGLGLAIAKKIMDYHNGTITVDSQPGKGATFVISLPVKS